MFQQKRRIDLITIGDYNLKDKEKENKEEKEVKEVISIVPKIKMAEAKKRVVLILARQHGGEPPASFVCQGKM